MGIIKSVAEISCRETEIAEASAIPDVVFHYSMELIQNQTYVRKNCKKSIDKEWMFV